MGEYFGKMSIKSLVFKKFFNVLAILLFITSMTLPVFAKENIISSVVISKAKNKQNAYELNIDSSKVVDYKMEYDEDGSVYFDLKNSVLSDDAGTFYDDVTDIDNVAVRQLDRNKVRIYITGQNAKNTELVFVNSLFDTSKQPKKIIINRPINEYKSTSGIEEDDLENEDETQDWNDNSFNFYHLISETLSTTKEGIMSVVLIVAAIIIFLFIALKIITSKISQDSEPLIGLNNTKKEPSPDYNNIPSMQHREINFNEIQRDEVLRNARQHLTEAHNKYQQYLKNKYNNNPIKTTSAEQDTLRKSIALNQYKKSDKNPYLDQRVIKMDEVNSFNLNQGIIPPRPRAASNKINTS